MRVRCFWATEFSDAVISRWMHAQAVEDRYTGNSETDYWASLGREWWGFDQGWSSDLVVIEQDIQIHERVIPEFMNCKQDWCVFPYRLKPGLVAGTATASLGCTRFSAELLEQVPYPDEAVKWSQLSSEIRRRVTGAGYVPHVHGPNVTHLKRAI